MEEKTGLPYASVATAKDDKGETVKVMHGCGHDIHMTALVGAAALLAAVKNEWRGTLILVGQPAEEGGGGASAMLKDGLLERFGRPDFALALHDVPYLPAGSLGVTPGYAHANSDRVDITVYGKGGHGSTPHLTVDPIVIAARIVVALQTIVARETDPLEPAVVTVGAIRGGTTYNIIPDETTLKLTVRSFKPEVRERLLRRDRPHREGRSGGGRRAEGAARRRPGRRLPGQLQRSRAREAHHRRVRGQLRQGQGLRAAAHHGRRGLRRLRPRGERALADVLARRDAGPGVRRGRRRSDEAALPPLPSLGARPRADDQDRRGRARVRGPGGSRQALSGRPTGTDPAGIEAMDSVLDYQLFRIGDTAVTAASLAASCHRPRRSYLLARLVRGLVSDRLLARTHVSRGLRYVLGRFAGYLVFFFGVADRAPDSGHPRDDADRVRRGASASASGSASRTSSRTSSPGWSC